MAPFIVSSFGLFVMGLFAGLFTTPSWQTFSLLAYGWAVAGGERQTITTYLWLSGATTVKHFSCFYAFLGGALYTLRWPLWGCIICCAVRWVPPEEPLVIEVDDSTKKKAGRHIRGSVTIATGPGRSGKNIARHRAELCLGDDAGPGAGVAGPEGHVPIGLSLYLKEEQAQKLQLPYQSQCPWPGKRGLCGRPVAYTPDSGAGRWGLCHQRSLRQLPATVTWSGG